MRAFAASPATAMTGRIVFRPLSRLRSNIKAQSFLIDGEAVVQRDDGTSYFRALRSKHRGREAVAVAFDMIEDDGSDLRDLPVLERKRRLKKLLGRAKRFRSSTARTSRAAARPCLQARLSSGPRRNRLEADRRAVSLRTVKSWLKETRRVRRCVASRRKIGASRCACILRGLYWRLFL